MYPYRENDLIAQCYLADDRVTEFMDQPRKMSAGPNQSKLIISPSKLYDVSRIFAVDDSLRLTSSARDFRKENKFFNSESDSRGFVRSDEIVKNEPFNSSMKYILNETSG